MNYLVEAILVGLFCVFLYWGLQWIKPFLLLLFVLGVLKHSLGYASGIESLYCNYGQACKATHPLFRTEAYTDRLFLESLMEGIAFVSVGLLFYGVTSKVYIVFLIGFFLHLLAEFSGLHTEFCEKNCRRTSPKTV
uniref:Uncharacterized protein n=1 Tax=viral metagenome TaxID=1070528 RepID=A0A6C0HPS1_9ZZZZ